MENRVEELEAGRLQAAKKMKKARLAGIPTYIITIICLMVTFLGPMMFISFYWLPVDAEEYFFYFWIIGILAMGVFIWRSLVCFSRAMVAFSEYNVYVKENIVLPVFSKVVTVIKYQPEDCFSDVTIKKSGLFRYFYYVRGNDLLEAIYKDRHFMMCDLRLREGNEDDKHNPIYISKFKGRFIILDSENFAESDELKTRISDRIQRFCEDTGDKMNVSFSDGKVFIAWHCRNDNFEADFFGKTDARNERERAIEGLKQVTDFLNCLPEKGQQLF
jgi:hypothetical protein